MHIRYSLLADGSSDEALGPILHWLLDRHLDQRDVGFRAQRVDLRRLREPPKRLDERIRLGLELFPCEILFVHRDAEGQGRSARVDEIRRAVEGLQVPPVICVVPVRMTEAWMLFDEAAIRRAAGNPAGTMTLQLPPIERLEMLRDPKETLHDLLKTASGLNKRRLSRFNVRGAALRVTQFLDDFSPLRALGAFRALEEDVRRVAAQMAGVPGRPA